jgi:hypothetical protein
MKLNDLIKELNAIKKVHGGDLECELMSCVTGSWSSIQSLKLIYPTDRHGVYDRTKAPWGIWVADFKDQSK